MIDFHAQDNGLRFGIHAILGVDLIHDRISDVIRDNNCDNLLLCLLVDTVLCK